MGKNDYMVRATAAGGMIRAFAVTAKDTAEEARKIHGTSPTATAALGRLLSAGLMMGSDMKDDRDLLTIRINCDGPIKGLLATADRNGHIKGMVSNPLADLPLNEKGKLDVGGLLDLGVLSVIKDIGLKEPYVGQTILVTGEIAEDIAYYYAVSEQVPSSVGLGVLLDTCGSVKQAGGFMLQMMPGADDALAEKLEERVKAVEGVTPLLEMGCTPEDILEEILGGMELTINEKICCSYRCDCSLERVSRALISIGREELSGLLNEGKDVETECHFCGKKYVFTPEDIKRLLEEAV